MQEHSDGIVLSYLCHEPSLEVDVALDFIPGADVVSQRNTVRILGTSPVVLTSFSSLFLDGVADSPDIPWYRKDGLRFHVCHNKWQGEGQWQCYTARQLGLYPTTVHAAERASHKISSIGSWSTANYYPAAILEDPDSDCVWYAEIEGSHSWYLKWYAFGGYPQGRLCLEASGCDEKSGWFVRLGPARVFRRSARFSASHRDACRKPPLSSTRSSAGTAASRSLPPLVYNDYMGASGWISVPRLFLP